MAKRNSTSKKSLSSNRNVLVDSVNTQQSSTSPLQTAKTQVVNDSREPHRRALHEAIEAERGRLSQAQSMLECLHLALENSDEGYSKEQAYYPDVVEIVLDIVRGSVNRLDSLYMRPLVDVV